MARKKAANPKQYAGNGGGSPSSSCSSSPASGTRERSLGEGMKRARSVSEGEGGTGTRVRDAHDVPANGAPAPLVTARDAKAARVETVQAVGQGTVVALNSPASATSGQEQDAEQNKENVGIAGPSRSRPSFAAEAVQRQPVAGSLTTASGSGLGARNASNGTGMVVGQQRRSRYHNQTTYKPYKPGDIVVDGTMRSQVVLPQECARELPTLTLPLMTNVWNCCNWELLAHTAPPFPRHLPQLTGIRTVICFDVMASNARDHSQVWRFMDSVSHRQQVAWVRSERKMSSCERTTVFCVKDKDRKMISQYMTFCRVESGKCDFCITVVIPASHPHYLERALQAWTTISSRHSLRPWHARSRGWLRWVG